MEQRRRLPRILCLHGSGTNVDIFQIQSRKLRGYLKDHFRFVFVNAPFPSPPGPGVLPFFDSDDDFYAWIPQRRRSRKPLARRIDLGKEEKEANEGLERALLEIGEYDAPFVGVMGFSQGAGMAASLLLRAQQARDRGEESYWSTLQFGILLNGTADCLEWQAHRSTQELKEDLIRIPTVQVHGLVDPWLSNGRMMLDCFFERDSLRLIEFNGGHHLIPDEDGTRKLAEAIREVSDGTSKVTWKNAAAERKIRKEAIVAVEEMLFL
jgi:pimeloyl-ACP methyl ester carboxylesterase